MLLSVAPRHADASATLPIAPSASDWLAVVLLHFHWARVGALEREKEAEGLLDDEAPTVLLRADDDRPAAALADEPELVQSRDECARRED
ncbi:hypothetical protein FI667_g998, partial [Globisporangium splendens]